MNWRMATHPLQLVIGFALWLLWFGLIYGAQAVGCSVAPPPEEHGAFTLINASLAGVTAVFCAGFAAAAARSARAAARLGEGETEGAPLARFVTRTAAWLYGACAVCTVVVGLPLAVVPPCV